MNESKNVVPETNCPHGHQRPTIELSGGWIQPLAPKKCKSPDCVFPAPQGLKFKKEVEVIKRIPVPEVEVTWAPCKRDGCVLSVPSNEDGHVGLCLLQDYDKPKIAEDENWAPPGQKPRDLPPGHIR